MLWIFFLQFWNPKVTSIFQVLAKTWLKGRNKIDTRLNSLDIFLALQRVQLGMIL